MSGPGFGVYVHWPFCHAKCPYCDFNSHVNRAVDQTAWRDGLLSELRHIRSLTGQRRVETVFFGGGTPSLMPPETVGAIIAEIGAQWSYAPDPEITLEANPTSVEANRFRDYRSAGVNRVSMGVQALNDPDLRALGRMHNAVEAKAAFDIARAVFDRISFDLIYARMGQSLSAWERELKEAVSMAVDHLSLYQLTIEPGTRFHDLHVLGKLSTPVDETAADMYELTQSVMAAEGMPAYEISNHARPGAESRHNLIYWRGGEWAGIGPGAHGRIEIDGTRHATETLRDPAAWLEAVGADGHALSVTDPLGGYERATEYLLMSMRLTEGAESHRFDSMGGRFAEDAVATALSEGLLSVGNGRIRATDRGRMILNRLLTEIIA